QDRIGPVRESGRHPLWLEEREYSDALRRLPEHWKQVLVDAREERGATWLRRLVDPRFDDECRDPQAVPSEDVRGGFPLARSYSFLLGLGLVLGAFHGKPQLQLRWA